MHPQMTPYRVCIHRGGTSKGIFINENELPKDREERNAVIRAIFGSPDIRQIDGLGGAEVLTSKLAIIGPSTKEGCDVDYTFAQVSFDNEIVDFGGNCGNISAGVGAYAIDEGLVPITYPVTKVKIHQVNTDCILEADVEVFDGKACVDGDCRIDGVPGTGSKILLDFYDTAGSTTKKVLPTGSVTDIVTTKNFGDFEVSIVDAGNVLVFITAEAFGIQGTESAMELEGNRTLMNKLEEIRSAAAVKAGMFQTTEEATAMPYNPFFAIVSKPAEYTHGIKNSVVKAEEVDIVSRLSFMLHMHKTYPGTGTVATGAAARIEGTVVYNMLSEEAKKHEILRIGHPSGVITVKAVRDTPKATSTENHSSSISFKHLAYERTARRIMDGIVYVRNSIIR